VRQDAAREGTLADVRAERDRSTAMEPARRRAESVQAALDTAVADARGERARGRPGGAGQGR
jgi:hypothetical protein